MAIVIRGYEKYLNDDDITQLIALMTDQKDGAAKQPLPELQKKLTSVSPSLQSEILGGGTQLGSKLGAETELEIRKDHPEYFKAPAKPNQIVAENRSVCRTHDAPCDAPVVSCPSYNHSGTGPRHYEPV